MGQARKLTYSPRVGENICAQIAEGGTLEAACEVVGLPRRTVRSWIERHPDFEAAYERARRLRADHFVDEIIAISDSVRGSDSAAAVQAARLATDNRRWLASKLLPGRFGDRLEMVGADGKDLIPAEIDSGRIALAIVNLLRSSKNDECPPSPVTIIDAEPSPSVAASTPSLLGVADCEPVFGEHRVVRLVPENFYRKR